MQIVDLPDAGGYFKPSSVEDADALLIEVLMFEPSRPNQFKGNVDTIHANVTAFRGDADPVTYPRVMINHPGLVRKLQGIVGNGTIQVLGKAKTEKGHDAWVWKDASPEAKKRVLEWNAALEAAAEDAPGFDD